jgi:hypothetical protein
LAGTPNNKELAISSEEEARPQEEIYSEGVKVQEEIYSEEEAKQQVVIYSEDRLVQVNMVLTVKVKEESSTQLSSVKSTRHNSSIS